MPRRKTKANKIINAKDASTLAEAFQSFATDKRTNPRSSVQLARTALEQRPREMIAAILRQETAMLLTMLSVLESTALKKAGGIVDGKGKLHTASAELLKIQGKLHQTTLALARVEGIPAASTETQEALEESGDVASIIQALDETA